MLLDWGGKIAGSLGYRPGRAMVIVLEKNGTVLTKKYGAVTTSELNSVNAEIDRQLRWATGLERSYAGPAS